MPDNPMRIYKTVEARAFVGELLGDPGPIPPDTWSSWLRKGVITPDFVFGKQNAGRYLEASLRAFAEFLAVNVDPATGYLRRKAKRLRRPDREP